MEQSHTMEAVLNECLELSNAGYKEVTLLGQNIDAYGRDMIPKRTFAELLEFLNENIPEKMRIRYVRVSLRGRVTCECLFLFSTLAAFLSALLFSGKFAPSLLSRSCD